MEKKKITLKEIGMKNLILLSIAGIVLIVVSVPDFFSFSKKGTKDTTNPNTGELISTSSSSTGNSNADNQYVEKIEKRLENILGKVEGIGEVEVMITVKTSKEKVILKDTPYKQDNNNETDGQGGTRISSNLSKEEETVLVQSEEGSSVPYVIKEVEPEIEGVVVIAQGGGNSSVVGEINSAIEALFGVPIHKIKVMKMSDKGKTP